MGKLVKVECNLTNETITHSQPIDVINRITDGIISINADWCYVYINDAAASIFQIDPHNMIGKSIWVDEQSGKVIPFLAIYEEAMREKIAKVSTEYYEKIDRWLENRVYPDDNGVTILFLDVTESKHKAMKQLSSDIDVSLMMSNLPGLVYRCINDGNWTINYVSEGCRQLTGYSPELFINKPLQTYRKLLDPDFCVTSAREWMLLINRNEKYHGEYCFTKATGELIWVFEQGQGIFSEKGELLAIEGLMIDITNRKIRELDVEYLQDHDNLTGVKNRIFFEETKKRIDKSGLLPVSLIIGDINGLKIINDALGHETGDRIIKKTAELFLSCCRESDTLSRTGGDEFSILLPDTDEPTAGHIYWKIMQVCESYNKTIENVLMHINVSLGYATKDMSDISIDSTEKLAEEYMNKRKVFQKKSLHSAIVSSIKSTLNSKSQDTNEHAERLSDITIKIGRRIHLPQIDLDELQLFSALHDIGKISVSDQILNKPGKLNPDEWAQMKRHSEIGYSIAIATAELMPIASYILSHHEHWDGSGYPEGISGTKIPLASRILAIADAYDAMTQDRVYRKSIGKEAALEEIRRNSGAQFDPSLVDVFFEIIAEDA